jgi:tetratricopeptide (TPR) repeat protein
MKNRFPKNPYPGLRPFEFAENHLFFGREGQSEEVLRRLRESHFVAVVGTSGSGKSSLVRAGLLPLLYGGFMTEAGARWRVALFRPGDNPIHNLAEALVQPSQFVSAKTVKNPDTAKEEELKLAVTETVLRRSAVGLRDYAGGIDFADDENLLVVVDQFEELFRFKKENKSPIVAEKSETQEKAENEAAAFVKLLLEAVGDKTRRVYVIITMRSDFLGDCAQFRDLPETINKGQYLIPRLTTEQLKKAIESPARVKGARIQPALVARLLNDIGDDQDQLPVLQHALMRTWDKWAEEGNRNEEITFDHYNATGGMATALSNHANEAFDELGDKDSEEPSREQKIAEKLFKCLTETDRENRETRRATSLGKICAIAEARPAEVVSIINTFRQTGRTFLMPPVAEALDENTLIDISHESLIRKWNRLKQWVEEEAQSSQTYRRLAEDALLNQKGKVGFWSDPELKDALDWKESFKPNETWAELYSKTWGTRYLSTYPEAIEYLEKSKAFREKELEEEEVQRNKDIEQERRLREIESEKAQALEKSAKRLRKFIVALIAMSILFFAVAAFAIYFAIESKNNANTAIINEEKARKSEANTNTALEVTKRLNSELSNKTGELKTSLENQRIATEKAEEQTKLAEEKTKLADEQTRQAEQSEDEKEIALEEQRRLRIQAEKDEQLAKDAELKAKKAGETAAATASRESLNRDALIFLEQNENPRALKSFKDLLTKYNTDEIEERADRINGKWFTLHNLGIVNSKLNNFKEAENRYKEALGLLNTSQQKTETGINVSQVSFTRQNYFQGVFPQTVDELNRNRITTLRRLAQLYRAQAEKTADDKKAREYNLAAIEHYNQLLVIQPKETVFEKQITYPADVYVELADTLSDLYDTEAYDKAADLYAKAAKTYEITGDFGKQVIVLKKWSDAAINQTLGDVVFAKLEAAVKIQEDVMNLSPTNPEIADTYNKIAEANLIFAYPEDAAPYQELAKIIISANSKASKWGIHVSNDGDEIDSSYSEITGLVNAYVKIGKCRRAEKVYLDLINLIDTYRDQSETFDSAGLKIIVYKMMAELYQKVLRDNEKAQKYFDKFVDEESRSNIRQVLSADKDSYKIVEDFYIEQKNYAQAGKLLERELIYREKSLNEFPNVYPKILKEFVFAKADVVLRFARLLEAENKPQEAEAKYLEAVNLVTTKLGEADTDNIQADIAQYYVYLGEFYESRNREEEAAQSYRKALGFIGRDSNRFQNLGLSSRISIKLGTFSKTMPAAYLHFSMASEHMGAYESSIKGGPEALNTVKQNPYYRYTKNGMLTAEFYTDFAGVFEILTRMESDVNKKKRSESSAIRARQKAEEAKNQEQPLVCK